MRRRDLVEQLVRLRRRRGLTQEQVEQLSGISQQQISKIESGAANPRLDTLLALALALQARIVVVAEQEVEPPPGREPAPDAAPVTGVADLVVPEEEADG